MELYVNDEIVISVSTYTEASLGLFHPLFVTAIAYRRDCTVLGLPDVCSSKAVSVPAI